MLPVGYPARYLPWVLLAWMSSKAWQVLFADLTLGISGCLLIAWQAQPMYVSSTFVVVSDVNALTIGAFYAETDQVYWILWLGLHVLQ
jgi:general stress protein CsbA